MERSIKEGENIPYIVKEERENFDSIIDDLVDKLKEKGITGNLNYVLFKLAKKLCHRYKDYAAFEGDCQQALKEIYRRQTSIYEDGKIIENGDVDG